MCCDDAPFDAGRMVAALAASRPIQNATAAFIRDHAGSEPRFAEYGIKGGRWKTGHKLRLIRSGAAALLATDAAALSAAYGGGANLPDVLHEQAGANGRAFLCGDADRIAWSCTPRGRSVAAMLPSEVLALRGFALGRWWLGGLAVRCLTME